MDATLADAIVSDAVSDAIVSDAAVTDGGSCIHDAVGGEACTAGQTSCATPCAERCNCAQLSCVAGTWTDAPPPEGCFQCGMERCMDGSQYCSVIRSDIGGEEDSTFCESTPDACLPVPSCACLAEEGVSGDCEAAGAGELTVSIGGG